MIEFFAGVGILCAIAKQRNMTQSFAVDKVKKRGARSAIVTLDLIRKDSQDLVQQWVGSSGLCWARFAWRGRASEGHYVQVKLQTDCWI